MDLNRIESAKDRSNPLAFPVRGDRNFGPDRIRCDTGRNVTSLTYAWVNTLWDHVRSCWPRSQASLQLKINQSSSGSKDYNSGIKSREEEGLYGQTNLNLTLRRIARLSPL